MNPSRALLSAGGLTAVVLVAVLLIGVRQGAFGLGPATAVVDTPVAASEVQALSAPDSDDRVADASHADDDDEERREDRGARRPNGTRRTGGASDRTHDDDD